MGHRPVFCVIVIIFKVAIGVDKKQDRVPKKLAKSAKKLGKPAFLKTNYPFHSNFITSN